MVNEGPRYANRDYEIMTNNVFHQLCELDSDDRRNNRLTLSDNLEGYDNHVDPAYLVDYMLHDVRRFIERDRRTSNVRLTQPGRQYCEQWIDVL